ncbi:hypothetical protein DZF93_03925 [Clavibacter michiganensis subsp. insidiosus]|uniref:Uncharacterized protein n=2 Tax=Clavibacter michiganensis TaxID=28447 RepID=A0A399SPB3_9MICO|nr:hypothetical protein B5P21_15935 [Clavibacter michiganensis subsp. insidiosus]RIJ44143.1 hypothetical protein DZF93_03925 [Clavibacter michiganensis subsp. insidiosus]RMC82702.1 hypothetical protein CmiCFBP2404_15080 [Clavibacter michiganensis subsp. insidiosus]
MQWAAKGRLYAVGDSDALEYALRHARGSGLETPWGTLEYLPVLEGELGGTIDPHDSVISIKAFLARETAKLIQSTS